MKAKQLWQNEPDSDSVLIIEVQDVDGNPVDVHHLLPGQSVITEITNPEYVIYTAPIHLDEYAAL